MPNHPIVGHIHLRVSNIDQSLAFYCDLLGFNVTRRLGDKAAFLAAGDYHHHIGLNTWDSLGATPPPPGHTGLFHSAFLYPDRASLGTVVKRVFDAGVPLDGSADHGVSEAVYFRDPDQNGVELYVDKPRDQWSYEPDGALIMVNEPLDIAALLAQAH